jgi:hypothetical protein
MKELSRSIARCFWFLTLIQCANRHQPDRAGRDASTLTLRAPSDRQRGIDQARSRRSQSGPSGTLVDLVGMQNSKALNVGPR